MGQQLDDRKLVEGRSQVKKGLQGGARKSTRTSWETGELGEGFAIQPLWEAGFDLNP